MPQLCRRHRLAALALGLLFVSALSVYGQDSLPIQVARRAVTATRTSEPPVIDGLLTDECWSRAAPASDFTQRDPDEGMPPTERTEIRILYDDDAVYVAARLFDRQPALVGRRLSSRDAENADADRVTIYLDSMHDRLTGAAFGVSASNVQKDTILFNDTFQEESWDAVWRSEVSIDEQGWSAEIRIPLSQLRFPVAERHTWGINVERFIHRKNETVWLEMVPKDSAGLVSRMIDLVGLDGLRPRRHIELLPYTAARAEFISPDEGDPFNDGSRAIVSAGLDAKWSVTSNLILDGTINPDFGQVEVDPAVVNLTAFETFFPEKRAFFLEGAQIFSNYGQGGSNSFWGFNTSDPTIFYSRRVGRAPQIDADADFVYGPASTTILGAAKLTGKTSGGWSVGLLDAVTDRETARTRSDGITERTDIEPLTNYTVARVQRELGRRGGIGFIATAALRRLDTASLRDALVNQAYVVGTDAYTFLDGRRDWVVTGKISRSHVRGSAAAVGELQEAAQRYFQRPDAPHVTFNPDRRALGGWAGRVNLNRNSGLWQVNAALWGVSPGFESNDLGFLGTGDRAGAHMVSLWRSVTPNRITRSRNVWVAKAWTWNYAREVQHDSWHAHGLVTFLNYWKVSGGGLAWRRALDDRLTRGGPSAISPGGSAWNVEGETDTRHWLSVRTRINGSGTDAGDSENKIIVTASIKPSPKVLLTMGPEWTRSRNVAQYVTSEDDPSATATFGQRYVFGAIRQSELSMTTRLSVIVTPRVSMQLFLQPLLAVGDYTNFKELARPRTFDFREYQGGGGALAFDPVSSEYTVDPDASRTDDALFSFEDPDFNLKSLRLNAVFRWEIKPGSNMYVVWTRQQEDETNPGRFALGRDARRLAGAPGDDVVMVKIAYWIGR